MKIKSVSKGPVSGSCQTNPTLMGLEMKDEWLVSADS
jgi:hypothetical protein